MGTLYAFRNCVRETLNYGISPQKLTGVIPKENLQICSTTHQVEACSWKLTGEADSSIITPSSEDMLMEFDWEGTLIIRYMVDWGTHETHSTEHSISEVDWGGNDSSSNHMNEFLLSEVDWGAHDSSFFLFLTVFGSLQAHTQ